MKSIIVLVALLAQPVFAVEQAQINCRDQATASWANTRQADTFREKLSLSHNFSSAELNCPIQLHQAIKDGRTVRCAGIWMSDFRRPDETVGTVAVLELTPGEEGKWQGNFTTNHDYDRKDITMECTAVVVESES